MPSSLENLVDSVRSRIDGEIVRNRIFPALIPVVILSSWFVFGEFGVLISATLLPLPFIFSPTGKRATSRRRPSETDGPTGLLLQPAFESRLTLSIKDLTETGRSTACFSVKIDGFARLREIHGDRTTESILRHISTRIRSVLRADDLVGRSGDATFIVALDPIQLFDLETGIQMATRIQNALEEPIPLQMASIYITCSIGFAMSSRLEVPKATSLIQASEMAMSEARRAGSSNIRCYTPDMGRRVVSRRKTEDEAAQSLQREQIQAWYQPQVSTDTGEVTGFEVLARWKHPERGILGPGEFLDVLQQTSQMGRLADFMLRNSLNALRAWDEAGMHVPVVGVNFSGDELRSPTLLEKIQWELDRTDITPDRLAIEILESVIAGPPEDMIVRNVEAISKLGCSIDLDDFGTGHASISSIRRLPIGRLKIDRSFVTNVDRDPDQQRMIAAIVTMAERLGLETLAEGVESQGEHAMLSQLGCNHVQGFGIARPMPFEQTREWMQEHHSKLFPAIEIGQKSL